MFTLPSPFSLLNVACVKCRGIKRLLHEQTYKATIALQEYLILFNGLSQSIMKLSAGVKGLRACLIVRISWLISFFLHEGITLSFSPQASKSDAKDEQESMDTLINGR